ncbi:MAG: peptidoglycan DD-metalloendopeptidase family protein [Nodosilinea sp.]
MASIRPDQTIRSSLMFGLGLTLAMGQAVLAAAPTPPGTASEPMPGRIVQAAPTGRGCPQPALERLTQHRVAAGETLDSIAQQYGLIPATVMGLNPTTQGGTVAAGQTLTIPPYNGIRVTVTPGQTWEQVAQTYNSRADVLFEVNGCVSTVPATVFVPGVNWFPGVRTAATGTAASQSPLQGYPLPGPTDVVINYGWQPDLSQNTLVFNTGVGLASAENTPVLAVGAGTVAFAGADPIYGNLVVINHAQGLQTRYANLAATYVKVGQAISQDDELGQVGPNPEGDSSFLFFEVRLNSSMGWVAQDPQDFVPTLAQR